MPPKKMEAKVLSLESRMDKFEATLAEMRAQAAADQEKLVSLLTQNKSTEGPGKTIENLNEEDGASTLDSPEVKKLLQRLQGFELDEFKQSAKKVELPLFEGEDPAGWIARAEIRCRTRVRS